MLHFCNFETWAVYCGGGLDRKFQGLHFDWHVWLTSASSFSFI